MNEEPPLKMRCLCCMRLYEYRGPEGEPNVCPKCGYVSTLDYSDPMVVQTWTYGNDGRCGGCNMFRGHGHLDDCDMSICKCGLRFKWCENCNPTPPKPDHEVAMEKEIAKIEQEDRVNHPSHYQGKNLEVIDVIEAFGLGFNLGNVVKYVLRSSKKGDRTENLRKALWYLEREIGFK